MSDTAVISRQVQRGMEITDCATVKDFKSTAREALLACDSKAQAAELLEDLISKAREFQRNNPNLFECSETRQLFILLFLRISFDFNYPDHGRRSWKKSITHYLGKSGMKNLRHELRRQ